MFYSNVIGLQVFFYPNSQNKCVTKQSPTHFKFYLNVSKTTVPFILFYTPRKCDIPFLTIRNAANTDRTWRWETTNDLLALKSPPAWMLSMFRYFIIICRCEHSRSNAAVNRNEVDNKSGKTYLEVKWQVKLENDSVRSRNRYYCCIVCTPPLFTNN